MEQVEIEEIPRASDKGKGEGSFNWSLRRLSRLLKHIFHLSSRCKTETEKYFMKCFSKNKIEWLSTNVPCLMEKTEEGTSVALFIFGSLRPSS